MARNRHCTPRHIQKEPRCHGGIREKELRSWIERVEDRGQPFVDVGERRQHYPWDDVVLHHEMDEETSPVLAPQRVREDMIHTER